ncbi:MAG: helix-turn-helix domain-containing protein [Desulfurivibrionaceae bacterium]
MMISERLHMVLRVIGWNQSKLAKRTNSSKVQVSRWMNGKATPTENSLRRISEATGCEFDWLVTGEGPRFQETSPYFGYMSKEEMEADLQGQENAQWEMQEAESEDLDWDEEDRHRARKQKISSLLTKTAAVLESNTIYCNALAATINAFYRAAKLEEKHPKPPPSWVAALREKKHS